MSASSLLKITLANMLVLFSFSLFAQPSGYSFGKQLLVNSSQVAGSTDLTNFVMLVNFTDTDLRSVANGGHLENSNGFDIVFTLADCSTLLDHQIEKYNATTGEFIAWVRIPILLASTNTNIHMYYGNSSVSTNPSTTNVWDSNYAAVWHMNQSPANTSPQITDFTANTNDGIANGSMTATDLVSGQIGNGIDFDGSNDFFDCGANASTTINNDITVSAWMFSRTVSGHVINRGGGWDDPGYSLFLLSGRIRIELQRTGEKDIVDNTVTINEWRHVALTYDQSTGTIRCFINGIQQGNSGTHTGPMGNPVENLNIGRKEQNGYYFNGIIDEGRVISAARNGDWLLTEYRNQSAPNTFYTKSAEFSAFDLCSILPIELIHFSAQALNRTDALIKWTTASELNNDYFILKKSVDGVAWIDLSKVAGAGNSSQQIDYQYIDENISSAIVYYKLKQVDFDGSSEESEIVSLQIEASDISNRIFPNPAQNLVIIKSTTNENIKIYTITGKLLLETHVLANEELTIDISKFSSGTYLVKSGSGIEKLIKY